MDGVILFSERQRFRQWWMWLLLLAVNGLSIYAFCKQVIGGVTFGDKPASNAGLTIGLILTLLVTLFITQLRLDTQVRSDGIYVRFFPFRLSFRRYGRERIVKAYIRDYSPITEYGGWGIRYGFSGKGKALTVSGNKGLQLELEDGSKLLIGTQEPAQLELALRQLGLGV